MGAKRKQRKAPISKARSDAARKAWETRRKTEAARLAKLEQRRARAAELREEKRRAEAKRLRKRRERAAAKREAAKREADKSTRQKRERGRLATLFHDVDGVWRSYSNGNGSGEVRHVVGDRDAVDALQDLEFATGETLQMVGRCWVQVGIAFVSADTWKDGAHVRDRYDRHKGSWTEWTNPRHGPQAAFSFDTAEGIINAAVEYGYDIKALTLRCYYGDNYPPSWRK